MIAGLDKTEIDPPFVVEYCSPRGAGPSGPNIINGILDRMKDEVLTRYAKED